MRTLAVMWKAGSSDFRLHDFFHTVLSNLAACSKRAFRDEMVGYARVCSSSQSLIFGQKCALYISRRIASKLIS